VSGLSLSHLETLMARDGHAFQAYIANPAGHVRGAVVVLQEIFGLTTHIRNMADSYAAEGYLAVAPALFDRVRRDLVLGSSPEEVERARGYRKQIPAAKALLDIAASVAVARHCGKVAVIGYCWGGTLAWLAAAEISLNAAVSYYGAGIPENLARAPKCPMMLHFGERDASIPPAAVEQIRASFPQGLYYLYAAGHAFNNETRAEIYDAAAAALARTRTLGFLTRHIG
jgi:carboxymethylenebutenolidase